MIHSLFALLSILSVGYSAPFNDRLSLPADTQSVYAAFNRTASMNAASLGLHDRCDSSKTQRWQAYAFLVEDCFVAVNQFYVEHVVRNPNDIFEFSANPFRAHTKYPRVQTPHVYTHESCTLAIVMLDWFAPGQLPGNSRFNLRSYDTSTSAGLFKAAKLVENECLDPPRRTPGWESAGAQGNIGVFLWATDSAINRQVTGEPGYDLTNGSSTGVYGSTAR